MGEIQKKTKILGPQIKIDGKEISKKLDDNSTGLFNERLSCVGVRVDEVEMDKTLEKIKLKVRLHNEKVVKVKEIIQVYIKDINSIYASFTPVLGAFKAIELNGQEETTIEIDICPEAFMIIDEKGDCYRDSNEFEIYISVAADNSAERVMGEHSFIKKIHFQNIDEEF